MNIIVTGGNFANKGAETMLLFTMSKLRERYPDAHLFYTSSERYDVSIEEKFDFKYIYKFHFLQALGKGNVISGWKKFKYAFIDMGRLMTKKNWMQIVPTKGIKQIIDETRLIVDVSGFTLSTKFSKANYIATDYYLDMVEAAHARGIKVVLLPQSFGPFDYPERAKDKYERIQRVLATAEIVFAREKSGYELLATHMGLRNVVLSDDLVLQANDIDITSICKEKLCVAETAIIPQYQSDNVGVVPNARVKERFDNVNLFYEGYIRIVSTLLEKGKHVFLIWHSAEDREICKHIKQHFPEEYVVFVERELEFYEYERFIEGFDYIIASRFHSIVHAYRHYIPCICLGWADKYKNLLNSCHQGEFLIDVSEMEFEQTMCSMINHMDESCAEQAQTIARDMRFIQEKSCFEIMFNRLGIV